MSAGPLPAQPSSVHVALQRQQHCVTAVIESGTCRKLAAQFKAVESTTQIAL